MDDSDKLSEVKEALQLLVDFPTETLPLLAQVTIGGYKVYLLEEFNKVLRTGDTKAVFEFLEKSYQDNKLAFQLYGESPQELRDEPTNLFVSLVKNLLEHGRHLVDPTEWGIGFEESGSGKECDVRVNQQDSGEGKYEESDEGTSPSTET